MVKKIEDTITRFDRMYERDRQTDGWTDRRIPHDGIGGKNRYFRPMSRFIAGDVFVSGRLCYGVCYSRPTEKWFVMKL